MGSIGLVNTLLLLGSLLVLAGIFSSLIASRFGAPLLLVFLVVGMLAGEDGPGGLVFNDYQATYLVGSLALAVILFDGGLRTKLASFRGVLAPAVLLATLGVFLTAAITGVVALLVLKLSAMEALLVGAIVASTDAAAVFFLLRAGGLQLKQRVGSTLEIESGTNDPFAVFLTVVLVEYLIDGQARLTWDAASTLGMQGLLGGALGLAGGIGASWLLNRVDLPSGLHPLFVVTTAVLIFSLAAVIGGSGFLAVYIAGLVVGNRPIRAYASITTFHDTATWLAQIVMFLVLGLLVTPTKLIEFAVPAVIIALWLIIVARPVAVWLCLTPFGFTWQEKTFVSWVGLRGAVSIFLAAIPMLSGLPQAEVYFNVAFFVVLVSLLTQGWTLRFVARRLGLALPRTTPKVSRVELDLPGQLDYELVGYPVVENSIVLERGAVPRWARRVMVVRDNAILDPETAGDLCPGDYAYLLSPPDRVYRLDRLFAEGPAGAGRLAAMGEFAFNGEITIGRLAELYGLEVQPEERDLTIAELFAERFENTPSPGDRLPLGGATLVVRRTQDTRVVRAGLQIEELAGSIVQTALSGGKGLASLFRERRRAVWRQGIRRTRAIGARPKPTGSEGAE